MAEFDRRERTRRHFHQPVAVEWQGNRVDGEATELTQEAIFVQAAPAPPIDAVVDIVMESSGGPLRVPCRVRRAAGDGFAAEFEQLSADQRATLHKMLAQLPY